MSKETQSVVIALLGVLLISITASGRYTSYVKPGLGPLLIVSGVVLILIGVISLIRTILQDHRGHVASGAGITEHPGVDSDDPEHMVHGHHHDRSRAPWLLLAPVLVLMLLTPAALGADAVAQFASSQPATGSADSSTNSGNPRARMYPDLPDDTTELSLQDFVLRAVYDAGHSVTVRPVAVTGFIAGAGTDRAEGYTIARFGISCCAADANPFRIYVQDIAPFPENTWVTAVVSAVPASATMANGYVPEVLLHSIQPTTQPEDPYLHPQYG